VLVAVDFNGTLSPFVLDPLQARAAAALGGVIAANVSRRDLPTLAAKSAPNPTTSAQTLCVRSAEQPGSVGRHRQRWNTRLRTISQRRAKTKQLQAHVPMNE